MTTFLQDKRLTIALNGEIDNHGAKITFQGIADMIDQYMPMTSVLDFKGVTFMDSSGLAIVIHTYRRMKEIGGSIKLRHVAMQPWKVLHAAGVDRIVETERKETNEV